MAKPERRPPSPAPAKRARPGKSPTSDPAPQARSSGSPPGATPERSASAQAVAIYEQALRTLQKHNYVKAAELFRHVAGEFPDERELGDRVRTYLAVCERQLSPPVGEPTTVPERLYAATLALNAGDTDTALSLLASVQAADPDNDQALYMLAVAHADRGESQVAIPYLRRAIALNPDNRSLARLDPDLEMLRAGGALSSILSAGPDAGGGPTGAA
ncbi:MAG: tetratricopeptide repeat protein [Vicinamibacterales bacterium]